MGDRRIEPRLQELIDKGCSIYSISRLNCLNTCPYQAYLNYIRHETQTPNVWAECGGIIHDRLEDCVKNGTDESQILLAINEELENLQILDIDFPLDKNGNPTLRNNWVANMTRFAKEFKTPVGEFETEQLILYPVKDNVYMQGYIDLIKHNADGSIDIIDWKTSSQFTGNHLIEAGRQLVLYALAKQLEGYTVRKLRWVMMKYCETTWTLKNGKEKSKVSEWRNLIKDLSNPIEKALVDIGWDEVDIECTLSEGIAKNSWDVFPQEIRDKFHTHIYVRDYEMTEEVINETLQYINNQIERYETLGTDESNWEPCDISKESFFCSGLCGYGGKTGKCKYWVDYCDQFTQENNQDNDEDDLF